MRNMLVLPAPSQSFWSLCLLLMLMIGTGLFLTDGLISRTMFLHFVVTSDYLSFESIPSAFGSIFNVLTITIIGFWATSIINRSESNLLDLKPLIVVIGMCLIIAPMLGVIASLIKEYLFGYHGYDSKDFFSADLTTLIFLMLNLALLSFIFNRLYDHAGNKKLRLLTMALLIFTVLFPVFCTTMPSTDEFEWPSILQDNYMAMRVSISIWALSTFFKPPAWLRLFIAALLVLTLFYFLYDSTQYYFEIYFEDGTFEFYDLIPSFLFWPPLFLFMILCLFCPVTLRTKTI